MKAQVNAALLRESASVQFRHFVFAAPETLCLSRQVSPANEELNVDRFCRMYDVV